MPEVRAAIQSIASHVLQIPGCLVKEFAREGKKVRELIGALEGRALVAEEIRKVLERCGVFVVPAAEGIRVLRKQEQEMAEARVQIKQDGVLLRHTQREGGFDHGQITRRGGMDGMEPIHLAHQPPALAECAAAIRRWIGRACDFTHHVRHCCCVSALYRMNFWLLDSNWLFAKKHDARSLFLRLAITQWAASPGAGYAKDRRLAQVRRFLAADSAVENQVFTVME